MESIFVLVIFFILITGGMIYYFNARKDTIREEQEKVRELDAIGVMQRLVSLNELRCSFGNFKSEVCFDKVKLDNFKGLTERSENKEYYFDLLGFSNVSIEFFETNGVINPTPIKLYNRGTNQYKSLSYFFTPIIVHDPINDENYYGILNISAYK